jgi:hypothetical protein
MGKLKKRATISNNCLEMVILEISTELSQNQFNNDYYIWVTIITADYPTQKANYNTITHKNI